MYKLNSLKEMKAFAGFMADKIKKEKPLDSAQGKRALVLALSGDLGSGKTTLAQYFLRALGVRGKITSPSFTLMKNYKLRIKNYGKAYHIDCYRIKNSKDFKVFDLKDIFNDPQNIVLIEWPERIKKILPKDIIWLNFEHGEKSNQRVIGIK
jgi:tRNA threonylcarbamoyladenosine biosynthesis protein TsaE